ncbi:MAG: hypothetical protein KGJ75_00830 [Alphaproteobacteria bacterium]|nr:hypothetical protein [Alphaproteobacteria bacterium]MDE2011441.1 hypothetical protein [Alphaproteobacteria bacterium]MDE2071832.1 hypothetical protein [Alphaproteobacteria bacterium]MDE2350495.1 hypothetical protein [Alphaproteobacteria bacterium]
MRIDPVIVLVEELKASYTALARARQAEDWGSAQRELTKQAATQAELRETEPTSVIGAAYLLREAAAELLASQADADVATSNVRLREAAARMEQGVRRLADLVWLRQFHRALAGGWYGRVGEEVAPLVAMSLKGAARPLLLYRAACPPRVAGVARATSETCAMRIIRDVS